MKRSFNVFVASSFIFLPCEGLEKNEFMNDSIMEYPLPAPYNPIKSRFQDIKISKLSHEDIKSSLLYPCDSVDPNIKLSKYQVILISRYQNI